jgi:SAM-dependent methyltransferase
MRTKLHRTDAAIAAGSPDRFGYEWHYYSELRPEYEEQFRRWTAHLNPQDWRGLKFLDVGCGMGRNSYWPMKYGAAGGLAVDVDSRSIAAARVTLAQFPTVRVEHHSAYDLGCKDEFDIAYSIGVVHHLENPEHAVGQMVAATKPGGRVLIWVYGLENNRWIVRFVDPLRKLILARLPIGLVHHFAFYPTGLLWLALRFGLGRTAYFEFLKKLPFRHLRSIVFDQTMPKIAHYWPRAKVENLMKEQGLADVRLIWVNEVSWSAIGTKPTVGQGSV